jgi:hypothetical protein
VFLFLCVCRPVGVTPDLHATAGRGERRGFGGAQLPSNRLVFLPAYAVQRTHDEFARLFARAGWSLQRVISTACPLSVLEAVPALDSVWHKRL